MTNERMAELDNMDKFSFNKWAKNNPEDYSLYCQKTNELADHFKKTVDVSSYMKMTSEEINNEHGRLLNTIPSIMVLSNGRMAAYGMALSEALFELTEEKRTYENACNMIDNTDLAGRRDIVGLEETPRYYADCGCCIESGGHTIITFSDKTILEFGNHGDLIAKQLDSPSTFFKWLKL